MTLMSRRALLTLPAVAVPKRKRRRCKVGMQPDEQGVFFQLIIQGGGEFTYDAAGNLRTANVGQTTTDPIQGITCYAGFSTFNGFGAVISLFSSTLDAQFWYSDTGTSSQGRLTSSDASVGGTDPFGNAYLRGVTNYFFASASLTRAVQLDTGDTNFLESTTAAGPFSLKASIGEVLGNLVFTSGAAIEMNQVLQYLLPTGVAVTDTANLAAILNSGFTPVLLPGSFSLNCGDATLTSLGPHQYIVGLGDLNTIINAHGSGDLFYWSAPSPNSDGATTGGGFIGGATIDMSACSGAAVGIHAGDINALRFDCRVQHSTKTGGSWGFLFDNANTFTERMHIDARVKDCGFAGGDGGMVGFQVSGAVTSTASFSRLKGRIELTQGSNQQDGVVVQAGAHIYDYDLEIIGNFQGGASVTTAAALRITGTVPVGHPGAGTHSAISNGRLNIGVECSTGAHTPTTFVQSSTSNSITDTYGNINWNQNFTSSGITGAGFKFFGPVQGDAAMGTRLYYGTAPTQTITANGQTISSTVPSAKIPISAGGPGFTGIILSAGDVEGQLIYLIGTGTQPITFAAAGTSNVALGTGAVLSPGQMMALIWDAGSALWYPAS